MSGTTFKCSCCGKKTISINNLTNTKSNCCGFEMQVFDPNRVLVASLGDSRRRSLFGSVPNRIESGR